MKRIVIIMLLVLAAVLNTGAQTPQHLRERVYLSTDKSAYVAGDMLWLSAFCADVNTGRLSSFSKTAYVEIHSAEGMVQTGKIALLGGRGAGRIMLENSLPTGNYKVIAYTAQSCNEVGYDYSADARTISVFNTLSSERVKGGVTVSDSPAETQTEPSCGSIAIETSAAVTDSNVPVRITNNGAETATFSLSVYHSDGIEATEGGRIGRFSSNVRGLRSNSPAFTRKRTAEYEGEIIRARVSGTDSEGLKAVRNRYAFISAPGNKENLHTASIGEDGRVSFYTSNIYGNLDLFSEIEGLPEDVICHIEIESPFVNADPGDIPGLVLSKSYADALVARSMSMQIEKAFDADTLYSMLPAHNHQSFTGRSIVYKLDDYTRFTDMSDVLIEYVTELRARTTDGRQDIQVLLEDATNDPRYAAGSSLMMIDGIPVLDQRKVLDYNPLLVEKVEIYPNTYVFGVRSFGGVANFITYKRNIPSMKFEDNVRIHAFQGTSFPLAYTCQNAGQDYPDYRQTIYWHPAITLKPGESMEIKCKTPAYSGRFNAVVEGLTDSLEAVSASAGFNVLDR